MANITPYITAIRTARYGEQVRGSIADALEAVNDQVEDDTSSAGASASSAANSATSAANAQAAVQSIADDLVDDLADLHQTQAELAVAEAQREQAEQARVVAEQARADQATGYVAQARNYANQAQQYASSDNALLSQSWAVGGTSSRYGEDTNNSKYWAEVAAQVVTEGGVASFNGRTGNVSPMSGDYNAEQITYGSSTVKSAMDGFTSAVDEIIDANLLVADDDATPTGEVDFTSADTTLTPPTSESVELLSGSDGWSTRLYKISQMFKNIRYLFKMLGTTNISSLGDGTITGAISALNGKTTSYLLTATVTNQTFTSGEMRAIQFTFTVPSGFRIVSMCDVSNWAHIIGVPISWGLEDGQVTAYFNYYASSAITNARTLTARAYAVKV